MKLRSINLLLIEKHRQNTREELIYKVLSRDLAGNIMIQTQGKAKIKSLDQILSEFDNPVKVETEEEIVARIEKVFGGKIKRKG